MTSPTTRTSPSPIVRTESLRRLPFQRRPVPAPGTQFVFQAANGQISQPRDPYTTGEMWWRGPRVMFVVDVSPHTASFDCTLPGEGDALFFRASVAHRWSVYDAVTVVNMQVSDAAADCRATLIDRMRRISRQYPARKSSEAEASIATELGQESLQLKNGIEIYDFTVQLQLDAAQGELARDLELTTLKQELAKAEEHNKAELGRMSQEADLMLQGQRIDFFAAILSRGGPALSANILAQDPTKAAEAARLMVELWERDQRLALESMKVFLDGDHVRVGEADDALAAAVKRFEAIVANPGPGLSGLLQQPLAIAEAPAAETTADSPESMSTPPSTPPSDPPSDPQTTGAADGDRT